MKERREGWEQKVNSCQIGQNIIGQSTPPQMKSLAVFVFLFVIVLLYQEVNNCQIVLELIGESTSGEVKSLSLKIRPKKALLKAQVKSHFGN